MLSFSNFSLKKEAFSHHRENVGKLLQVCFPKKKKKNYTNRDKNQLGFYTSAERTYVIREC